MRRNLQVILILPSLSPGGLEKVITELAWYGSRQEHIRISVVSLSRGELFYPLPPDISLQMPPFSLNRMVRPLFLVRLMRWLRRQVKNASPDAVLSFGGRFNAFVLISLYGLPVHTYISDRSRPSIGYGTLLDMLNPLVYKRAAGIVAQTETAGTIMQARIGHPNIRVIGNPVTQQELYGDHGAHVIVNVGRFIPSKQQELLVGYFASAGASDWKLILVGDGPTREKVKERAAALHVADRVVFQGVVKDISAVYRRSSIFAFTSASEGFPNALCEAMAHGLACISFDCEAGPSELIEDGVNGYLVTEGDHRSYRDKLGALMADEAMRRRLGSRALEKATRFSTEKIGKQYFDFLKGH